MFAEPACLFLLSALCTVSAESVIGVLGGTATLPCHMRQDLLQAGHHSKFPAASVQWTRDNRSVVRVTPGGITYAVQSVISRAAVRHGNFQSGVFSLQLKNLKEKDAGIYRALMRYGDSKQACTVTLSILKVTQSSLGLLPENGAVNVTCDLIGHKRFISSYRWLRGGLSVLPSNRISQAGPTLFIRRLTQEDRGEWSCEVEGVRASLMLNVLSLSGPPHISVYASVGSPAELPCNLTEVPMDGPLSVQWRKGKVHVRGDNQVLAFSHVTPEHAGTYRCDIEYRSQLMTRNITLKVIQVLPSGPTFAKDGSSLRLECNVTGVAEGERYEWTGPENSTWGQDGRKGAVLNLPAVHREDSGTWTCSVHGKSGILGKAEHWLYVHAAQTSEFGSFSSWQTYIVFLLCLLLILGLIVIASISIQNRRRRLSHLAALTAITSLPAPQPKKVPDDD